MSCALDEAKKAFSPGEIPVGAVIVKDNQIIAQAHNLREANNSIIAHAEILALTQAEKVLSTWRLNGCSIYVTLEPCIMCFGAILESRISAVYFGAYNHKSGACSYYETNRKSKIDCYGGIMEIECQKLLTEFFNEKRQ